MGESLRADWDGGDFWIFGYGSLMWDPGFPHVEVRLALLHGYHRAFCVDSTRYRGTKARPGLVLGLDRGGSCRGLAYRVPAAEADPVYAYLEEREMTTRVYRPSWLKVATPAGPLLAGAYVVDPAHSNYMGHLSRAEVVARIRHGRGTRGSNLDYLRNTVRHLEAMGLGPGDLGKLLKEVEP